MSFFEIGDMVLVTKKTLGCYDKMGKVKRISSSGIGVEFSENFEGGHNLNGTIPNDKGFYMTQSQITKMFPLSYIAKNQSKPKKTALKKQEPVFIIEE